MPATHPQPLNPGVLTFALFSAGALVDMFGDYSYMFYMCGAVMITAGLFLFVMNYYNYRRKDLTQHAQENGTELVERNAQDGRSQGMGSGTRGVSSETEDLPV